MKRKAQGALEYLLLIGGAILVAAIVIAMLAGAAPDQTQNIICNLKTTFKACSDTDGCVPTQEDMLTKAETAEEFFICLFGGYTDGEPECIPDGCNGTCPPGCTATEDPDCDPAGCCGDGTCDAGETYESCPGDCPPTCDGTDTSCGTVPPCENCNDLDGCEGAILYDYYCAGRDTCDYSSITDCSADCLCTCGGFGVDESTDNGNCKDGIDNDCDGRPDIEDPDCLSEYLVAWWKGNGNTQDEVGANHGTWPNGGAAYATGVDEQAFSLTNVNNGEWPDTGTDTDYYIDFGDDSSISFNEWGTYTYSAWIYTNADTFGPPYARRDAPAPFSDEGSCVSPYSSGWDIYYGSDRLKFWGCDYPLALGPIVSPLLAERWYHIAMTYYSDQDDYRYFHIFVDGKLEILTGTGIETSLGNFLIGARCNGEEGFWGGRVDDMRIYNGVLTDAEICELCLEFESGAGITCDCTLP